jgi:predicted enzyme related to lactoylglutathione lyase
MDCPDGTGEDCWRLKKDRTMDSIAYFEIQADQPSRAVSFYSRCFNWKFSMQEGLPIEYWRIETSGIRGGLLKRSAPPPPQQSGTNAYVCSVEVGNFDETAGRILSSGGVVALPKFAVPGVCWQGYFLDTEGNTLGIFQPDKDAG